MPANSTSAPSHLHVTADDDRRLTWTARWISFTTLALMSVTWRLWFDRGDFPQVPLVGDLRDTPTWLENGAAALSMLIFAAQACGPKWLTRRRALWAVHLVTLSLLFATNQHRLQPWAYHAWLTATVLALSATCRQLSWLRALLISVYIYAALGKLDATFLQGLGHQLMTAAAESFGLNPAGWSPALSLGLTILLPLGELLVGLLLIWPRSRPWGVVAGVILHGILVGLLGPWKLNHQPPVLLWNVGFAAQLITLFGRWPVRSPADQGSPASAGNTDLLANQDPAVAEPILPSDRDVGRPSWQRWLERACDFAASALVIAALILPLGENWQLWDHWLSWGLYAPRASRTELWILADDVDRLPASARRWAEATGDDEASWRRVRLDRWSLEVLHVPVYPQARFQLGVAAAVAERTGLDGPELQATLWTMADRRTGRRQQERLVGRQQLWQATRRFWWGARPAGEWPGSDGRP